MSWKNKYDKPPPPRDHRQEVTDEVIRLLEAGTSPWQQPWKADLSMPMNPTTGKPYRGGNVISLMIASMVRGYSDPRFMTFLQAEQKGWHVKKGEKGIRIEFWEPKPGSKEEGASDDEKKSRLVHRVYSVFNAQQIEGIPPIEVKERKPFEVIEAAEAAIKGTGAHIRHGGAKAFYSPSGDYIQMPERECFVDEPHYYATLLHELAHWTGAKSRLDRDLSRPFGSEGYSREEIRADLTSLFLSAELGVPFDPQHQAGYIASWIKVLKNDKNEVFKAAADASKACDFILGKDRAIEQPEEGHHAAAISASRSHESRAL